MSEKQFDILDEHFKNAAEEYEPAFSEAAWKKMEAKLDGENDRKKPAGWYWWFSDALILAMILFIAISLYNQKQQINTPGKNQLNDAKQSIAVDKKPSTPKPQPRGSDKVNTTLPEQITDPKPGVTKQVDNSTITVVKSPVSGNPQKVNTYRDDAAVRVNKLRSIENKIAGHTPVKDESVAAKGNVLNKKEEDYSKKEGDSKEENIYNKDAVDLPVIKNETAKVTIASPSDTASLKKPDTVVTDKKQQTKTKSIKSPGSNNSRFFLHAGAGPEWSFVPGNKMGPVTLAYGAVIGYSLGKRWSLQVGMYATKKNYKAAGNDYKARPGTYYYNLTINNVDAYCNIIEMPLTINYALLHRKHSTVFASAGFSSLLMSKETYHYDYKRWNGSPAYAVHTYKTNNFHPFAGVMLAAGYKIKLNDDFAISASPYLKIPIYGVGEGKVKIGSAGLLMNLQYQLPSLRKQPHK